MLRKRKSLAAFATVLILSVFCLVRESRAQEPQLISLFPLGSRPGTVFKVDIRGQNLEGVYAIWLDCSDFRAEVLKLEPIDLGNKPRGEQDEKGQAGHRILVEVSIDQGARIGTHALRVISPRGVSNALWLQVNSEPIITERESALNTSTERQVVNFPVVINGRIGEKGEVDYYGFDAFQGQNLLFQVFPGNWPTRSPVPLLALYEPTGSWFDANRLTRLTSNTQSILHTQNLSYAFKKNGQYLVEVGELNRQGGADYAYQLRIIPVNHSTPSGGEQWPTRAHQNLHWQERNLARKIDAERLSELWSRTVKVPEKQESTGIKDSRGLGNRSGTTTPPEEESMDPQAITGPVTRAVEQEPNGTSSQALEVGVPSIIEGVIERPGDVDYFKFRVKSGQKIAFEIETGRHPSLFNIWMHVLDSAGEKVLTNLYKEVGGDGDDWLKKVEPKVIYTFEKDEECFLKIRDLTSRYGSAKFLYKVLIRPQIPHVGEVKVNFKADLEGKESREENHLNLIVGRAIKLTVITEEEEGFDGEVAVLVENLPTGVHAFPAAVAEPKTVPPLPAMNKERFRPSRQKVTIMLVTSANAPTTRKPTFTDIKVRPIVDGHLGTPLFVRQISLMVVSTTKTESQEL